MPGPLLHIQFLKQILRESSINTLFQRGFNDRLQSVAIAGTVAPDIGYALGTRRLISDAAHYVRTADLVRSIWHNASAEDEKAFALGWAAHWLLDVRVHPLINRAAANCWHSNKVSIAYAEDPFAHIAVEFGLEVQIATSSTHRPFAALNCRLPDSLKFVMTSFRQVYGNSIPEQQLIAAFRRLPSWHRWTSRFACLHRPAFSSSKPIVASLLGFGCSLLGSSLRLCSRRSAVAGLMLPQRPSPQLQASIQAMLVACVSEFLTGLDADFRLFPNSNLDTGELDRLDLPYLPAITRARPLARS